MIEELQQIEYRVGMLEEGMRAKDLPVRVWSGAGIPTEIRKAVDEENLCNLSGVYGDKGVGDPLEYDHLKLVMSDRTVEITVFNRGITLFTSDNERVRRIHRVLCRLPDTGKE